MPALKRASQGLSFEAWYSKVDTLLINTVGVGIDDLADGPSYDCWESDMTPAEYAIERLTEEGLL
jgi:hypothetical protein